MFLSISVFWLFLREVKMMILISTKKLGQMSHTTWGLYLP